MSDRNRSPAGGQPVLVSLDSKGRFTLTDAMLAHMGVDPGQRLQLIKRPDGSIELKAAPAGVLSWLVTAARRLLS